MEPPNDFERSILTRLGAEQGSLAFDLPRLRVRRRAHTGIGTFTDFECDAAGMRTAVRLKTSIAMPGVPGGLDAILFCRGQQPESLEIRTHGETAWSGQWQGFAIG